MGNSRNFRSIIHPSGNQRTGKFRFDQSIQRKIRQLISEGIRDGKNMKVSADESHFRHSYRVFANPLVSASPNSRIRQPQRKNVISSSRNVRKHRKFPFEVLFTFQSFLSWNVFLNTGSFNDVECPKKNLHMLWKFITFNVFIIIFFN